MQPLKHVSVELTTECNCRCPHCFISNRNINLPKEKIFEFIDKNPQNITSHITLTGGEVFLRKDLKEIIDYIHSKKLGVAIITNGSWNPELLNSIKPDMLKISLDFPNKYHSDWRGFPNLFEKIINGIIPTAKDRKIPIEILCTATTMNYPYLKQIIELAEELKVKPVLVRYMPNSSDDTLMPDQEHLMSIFSLIGKYRNLGMDLGFFGGLSCLISGEGGVCSAGLNKIHVNVLGDITPCMFYSKKFGDITQDLDKVRKSILEYREQELQKAKESCGNCSYFKKTYCTGDCLAISERLGNVRGQCWELGTTF